MLFSPLQSVKKTNIDAISRQDIANVWKRNYCISRHICQTKNKLNFNLTTSLTETNFKVCEMKKKSQPITWYAGRREIKYWNMASWAFLISSHLDILISALTKEKCLLEQSLTVSYQMERAKSDIGFSNIKIQLSTFRKRPDKYILL